MTGYVTLDERKAAKVAAIKAGVAQLAPLLAAYAHERRGRFVLYGSAARGDVRYDSDINILVDFPAEAEPDASRFAEDQCVRLAVTPDVLSWSFAGSRLRERAAREGRVLE
jgi:hypothetical protein